MLGLFPDVAKYDETAQIIVASSFTSQQEGSAFDDGAVNL
jgi:hypothetical protein